MLTCFSAESIVCRSALSPSDWQDLLLVVKKAGATKLDIEKFDENTPDSVKRLGELCDKTGNVTVYVKRDVKFDENTPYSVKRLCNMSDKVTVRVGLRKKGWCYVQMKEEKIIMSSVHLYPGDVSSLAQLLSGSQSWQVKGCLALTNLSCDDWGELAQLVQSLDSLRLVFMTGVSPSQLKAQPLTEMVRHLWDKTENRWNWYVNGERYHKSDESLDLYTFLMRYCT